MPLVIYGTPQNLGPATDTGWVTDSIPCSGGTAHQSTSRPQPRLPSDSGSVICPLTELQVPMEVPMEVPTEEPLHYSQLR
jgi:hypothetical protein